MSGSEAGGVWSLDLATGCTHWKFDTEAGVRTAVTVERIGQNPPRYAAFFGDLKAWVYAVDAQSGALLWKARADEHAFARISGAPSFSGNRLFVTVSSIEEVPAARPNYPCCTFRGSVLALDATTGKELWKTYMIAEEAKPVGKNATGTPLWKPAGVAIWSSPTIDAAKNAVYVGTGNAYTEPAAPMSDSIVALDMTTGAIRWFNQITPNDSFIVGCKPGNLNCPESLGPDHDFGSSPILRTVAGRRILLLGQKSGVIFGLDPDNGGKVLWQQRVGKGSELGGIEWGPAADLANVYVALSDVIAQGAGPSEQPGGLHALKIENGERLWHTPAPALTCTRRAWLFRRAIGGCQRDSGSRLFGIGRWSHARLLDGRRPHHLGLRHDARVRDRQRRQRRGRLDRWRRTGDCQRDALDQLRLRPLARKAWKRLAGLRGEIIALGPR